MSTPRPTRRERLRRETLAEIRERALAQVDAGGAAALSLNAIAKDMGMSGPALYRYFSSRDELLAALVADGYTDLTAALEAAAGGRGRRALGAIAHAYRDWALEHPRRFALLFGDRPGDVADSAEAIANIHGGMEVLLGALPDAPPARPVSKALAGQLTAWEKLRSGHASHPPATLLRGITTWSRIHGLVALEMTGAFADMGVDPGALLDAEVDAALRD